MRYVQRLHTARLRSLLRSFPAVLLVGPRQCGKSTLARHALPDWSHFDLERPADFALLAADPEGFFDANPRRVVIDEAHDPPAAALPRECHHSLGRDRSGRGQAVLGRGMTFPPLSHHPDALAPALDCRY